MIEAHTLPIRSFLFLAQPADAPAKRPWALVWAESADAPTYTRAEPGVFYTSEYAAQSAGLAKFQEFAQPLQPLRRRRPTHQPRRRFP